VLRNCDSEGINIEAISGHGATNREAIRWTWSNNWSSDSPSDLFSVAPCAQAVVDSVFPKQGPSSPTSASSSASNDVAQQREDVLRSALRSEPGNATTHFELGKMLWTSDKERAGEAAQEFGEAARLHPGMAEAHRCVLV